MGVGPRKHLAGFTGIEEDERAEGSDGVFAVEVQQGDGWREIERATSRAAAEEALDQLAATGSIDLGDLRVRELD